MAPVVDVTEVNVRPGAPAHADIPNDTEEGSE